MKYAPAAHGPAESVEKVSHSLATSLAQYLERFAFQGRFSESAVIEAALQDFFGKAEAAELYVELKQRGYGRRRPSTLARSGDA